MCETPSLSVPQLDIDGIRSYRVASTNAVFQQPSARVSTKTQTTYHAIVSFGSTIGRVGCTAWSGSVALRRIGSTAAHRGTSAVSDRPAGCGTIYIVPDLPNTVLYLNGDCY